MAGLIPQSFIDDLLNRTDIVEVVSSRIQLKKAGKNYTACCPFHKEKTPSFSVSPDKQFYYCFGCGAGGNALGFIMDHDSLDFPQAVEDLAKRAGMDIPREEGGRGRTPRQPVDSPLYPLLTTAADYYRQALKSHPTRKSAVDYLKGRGLTGEIARDFGLGFAPPGWDNLHKHMAGDKLQQKAMIDAGLLIENAENGRIYDRFRDRVMFPIRDSRGRVIAFGGRVLGDDKPKYLNSPETPVFHKGQELYGLYEARKNNRDLDEIMVVEGYMDVVALAQHGIGNAVATLGTATTATHVQKLLRQVDRIVYCFDGDSAGKKAAWRALENSLEALPEQKSIGFVFLPEKDDPDSFVRNQGKEAFERMITQAVPLSEFLLRELSSRCDMTSAEGRAKLVSEAKPLLGRLQTPLLRLQLVKRLSEASGFSQSEVERLCDLRPVARAAPARAPQKAPSLLRPLLRLLLQKPELAKETPYKSLPENVAEARAVKQLCEAILASEVAIPTYNALLERLRGSEDEAALREAAAELMQQPFAEEDIDAEFQGVIQKLLEAERKRAFARLQEKVNKLGAAGLSSEEKQQYLQALAFKR
mgnify:CR=1 FL=1